MPKPPATPPTNHAERRDSDPVFTHTLGYTIRKWTLIIPLVMVGITSVAALYPDTRDTVIGIVLPGSSSTHSTNTPNDTSPSRF